MVLDVLTINRLDIKTIFTDSLITLQKKVQDRFYTTALNFTHDLCEIFRFGINTEPAPKPETAAAKELEKSSPFKKTVLDMRGRRSLAKRILKAVQPQLEAAVRAEADISGKSTQKQLKDLEQAIEAALQTGPDSISLGGSVGDAEGDHDHDVEMTNAAQHNTNGHHAVDVDMDDADAPGEDDEDAIITVSGDTINTDSALAEVNGNVSQTKPNHINGNKNATTPPDTNGYSSAPENMQPSPPTPPVSNRDISADHVDFLAKGGVPWYLKDFQPEGTSLLQGNEGGANLNDILDLDEDAIANGDYGEVLGAAVIASPSKSKKGKAKKKARSSRR
jgi:NuA3 HAT complex component NTO1